MFSAHTLADMTNAWAFSLHPGVDHCLKCRYAISALSAIKALEPIHLLVLSDESHKYATHNTVSSERYCIIVGNPFTSPDVKKRLLRGLAAQQTLFYIRTCLESYWML